MEQLELRFYTRPEIAEALSVNIKDTRHFAERVKDRLQKWGYDFHYINRKGVEILSKPETPAERLAEILYRGFGIDIQINAEQFACFIAAFTDIEGFESMPWEKREDAYYDYYDFSVSGKTLRNWCKQLIERGVIARVDGFTIWRTTIEDGIKHRKMIEESDEENMEKKREYFKRRAILFKDYYESLVAEGTTKREAKKEAWDQTYKALWAEYDCCYYYCKRFMLSAFSNNGVDVFEIYELSQEIAAAAPPPPKPSITAPATEDYEF